MDKRASSQAAWALLTEGVTRARLDAHRIRQAVGRAVALVEASDQKEHLYQVAGDVIAAIPLRLDSLEVALDRTSLALAKMGDEFLGARLPLADKTLVDEAIASAFGGSGVVRHSKVSPIAQRVAQRYLRADLSPPLGKPGGPCQVVRRIENRVPNPAVKEDLIDDVERGTSLNNPDASKVYSLETEALGGLFRRMILTAHAQYRMDLRGMTVALLQRSLTDLATMVQANSSVMRQVFGGREYVWNDPKRGITVVLEAQGRDAVKVITVYPTGQPDPKPPGEGGCDI